MEDIEREFCTLSIDREFEHTGLDDNEVEHIASESNYIKELIESSGTKIIQQWKVQTACKEGKKCELFRLFLNKSFFNCNVTWSEISPL